MYELTIPAMTCGHCQKAITAAVRALDSRATLRFDMATHRVSLTTTADLNEVKQALDSRATLRFDMATHRVSLTTTADLNEVKQALDAAGYAAEGAAN